MTIANGLMIDTDSYIPKWRVIVYSYCLKFYTKSTNFSNTQFTSFNVTFILISVQTCKTLDSGWRNVATEPTLPVPHGQEVEITLNCPADQLKRDQINRAICQDGKLVPNTIPFQCFPIGMCFEVFSTTFQSSKVFC